jgi:phosphoribosylglycinamide formyltransferase 2
MTTIGTPDSSTATRVMLLGSGELGKEVAIELQRWLRGDRGRPLPQCAGHAGGASLARDQHARWPGLAWPGRAGAPDLIVPEIEAIATDTLKLLEAEGTTRWCRPRGQPI